MVTEEVDGLRRSGGYDIGGGLSQDAPETRQRRRLKKKEGFQLGGRTWECEI